MKVWGFQLNKQKWSTLLSENKKDDTCLHDSQGCLKKKIFACIHQRGILQSIIFGEKRGKTHLIKLQAYGEVLRQVIYGLD